MVRGSALGGDEHIATVVLAIDQGQQVRLAGLTADGLEDQACASEGPPTGLKSRN